MVSLNFVHPLKIYQRKKCHGLTLTGANFSSTSEVRMFAIFELLDLKDYKLWFRSHLLWKDLPTEFHKKYTNSFKKLLGATQHGDLLRLAFLFKESRIETINISVFIVFLILEGLIIRE
jgi:hypothetical protein